ncbi:MAG TPA: hypothetical protein VJX47_09260 [Candidatus Sulfotelmatobacter sp.]|nr:hypothetical protein [Candidatus Sulfotelmatobacter sp.]
MSKFFSQLVAMMVLGAVVAGGAGVICVVSSSAHSSSSMAGCHPGQMPSQPHPADYRCCLSRHAVPLVTSVVSPQRPALQALEASVTPVLAAANEGPAFLPAIAPSGGPPGVVALRI